MYFSFILLFISTIFASPDFSVVVIAGSVSGAIIGLAFMLANILSNPALEGWAKAEFGEFVIGAITVVLVYALTKGSLALLPALTGNINVDDYLLQKTNEYKQALFSDAEDMIRVSHRVAKLSSFYYTRTSGLFFYFGKMDAPFMGIGGIRTPLMTLADGIVRALMIYDGFYMLHLFFSGLSDFLFTIGFALRIIPFTRKSGALLMAVGFAGAVIFPWMFYFATYLHDTIVDEMAKEGKSIHSLLTSDDLYKLNLHLSDWILEICSNKWIRWLTAITEIGWWAIVCPVFCAIFCVTALIGWAHCFISCVLPITGWCFTGVSTPLYALYQHAMMITGSIASINAVNSVKSAGIDPSVVYDIVMNKLILPVSLSTSLAIGEFVFVCAMTILSVRSLSEAFGGDISIIGFGRLI
jgi:hypothetical protein